MPPKKKKKTKEKQISPPLEEKNTDAKVKKTKTKKKTERVLEGGKNEDKRSKRKGAKDVMVLPIPPSLTKTTTEKKRTKMEAPKNKPAIPTTMKKIDTGGE